MVAIRNPLSVARSRAKLDALRGRQEKSDLEWLVNVVPYFRTMTQHRFVVVDYELLLADPQAQHTFADRAARDRPFAVGFAVDEHLLVERETEQPRIARRKRRSSWLTKAKAGSVSTPRSRTRSVQRSGLQATRTSGNRMLKLGTPSAFRA